MSFDLHNTEDKSSAGQDGTAQDLSSMSCNYKLRYQPLPAWLLILCLLAPLFHLSYGDVGTAGRYTAPFLPTACFGNNPAQFPSSNLFGAAGEGIWDNGAACGRQYKVRCISAAVPRTCFPDKTIQIIIVDRAQTSRSRPSLNGATIVLSNTAFGAIADAPATSINIEFAQV